MKLFRKQRQPLSRYEMFSLIPDCLWLPLCRFLVDAALTLHLSLQISYRDIGHQVTLFCFAIYECILE